MKQLKHVPLYFMMTHDIQDQVVQERLVEKYMQLPNQIWENIIAKASQVCNCIYCDC